MVRIKRGIVLILAVMLLFTGCSAGKQSTPATEQESTQKQSDATSEQSAEKVKAEYWTWLSNDDVVGKFNASQDQVEVVYNKLGYADLTQKLTIAQSAGSGAPDIFQMTQRNFSGFSSTGKLYDITGAVQDIVGEFPEALMSIVTYDNKIYGLPNDVAPGVFWYRKDIYDQAGIGPINTFSEFEAAGAKLKEKNLYVMPVTMPSGTGGPLVLAMYLQSRGGNFYTADGKVVKNNTELEFVLNWLSKMLKNGYAEALPHLTPEFWGMLKQGDVVSWPFNTPESANIKKNMPELSGKWSVALFPKWDDKDTQLTGLCGGSVHAIPEQSKVKEQALSFVKWYAGTVEGQVAAAESNGAIPAMKSAFKDEFFTKGDPYFSNENIFEKIGNTTPFYYYDWAISEKVIAEQLDLLFTEKITPAQAREAIEQNLSKETGR